MDIRMTVERFIIDELMMGDSNTQLDPDQSLISSGILDSLALLRLISFLEEEVGVTIDDDEVVADNFQTLNVIQDFVHQKIQSDEIRQ